MIIKMSRRAFAIFEKKSLIVNFLIRRIQSVALFPFMNKYHTMTHAKIPSSKTLANSYQIVDGESSFLSTFCFICFWFSVSDHYELTLTGLVHSLSIPAHDGGFVDIVVTHIDYGLYLIIFAFSIDCFLETGIVYGVLADLMDALKLMENDLQQLGQSGANLFNPVYGNEFISLQFIVIKMFRWSRHRQHRWQQSTRVCSGAYGCRKC